jgi:hypothetical protein
MLKQSAKRSRGFVEPCRPENEPERAKGCASTVDPSKDMKVAPFGCRGTSYGGLYLVVMAHDLVCSSKPQRLPMTSDFPTTSINL